MKFYLNKLQPNFVNISVLSLLILCSCGETPPLSNSSDEFSSEIISNINSSESIIETRYLNPVFKNEFADPSVFRDEEGVYWAFATEGGYATSIDLINWTYEGNIFMTTGSPLWGSNGAHIWAPDVVKIGDTYLYYYSLSAWGDPNPGIGYNYTTDLNAHNWTAGEKLFDSNEIGVPNSIDPQVIVDDGHVYMLWGSFRGIYAMELTTDGREIFGGLAYGVANKIQLTNNWYEGVYVQKINEYYYMFVSSGSCCAGLGSSYHVKAYRSKNLLGPYVDNNGINALDGGGKVILTSSSYFVGPGHNGIAIDDFDQYWIVYHSYSLDSPNKRQLLIDQLLFDKQGWPFVLGDKPSHSLEYVPKILLKH